MALGKLGPEAVEAGPDLVKALENEDPRVVREAITALRRRVWQSPMTSREPRLSVQRGLEVHSRSRNGTARVKSRGERCRQ